MRVYALACACLFVLGCSLPPQARGAGGTSNDAPRRARASEGPHPTDPQPDPDSAFARDTRAEAVLGRIGLAAARVRRGLQGARADRDVVKVLCLSGKLEALSSLEQAARGRRSELRDAALDAPAASDAAWAELGALSSQASQLEAEAQQCVGEEMAFAGQSGGLAMGRIRDLEQRVDALKESTFRTQVRGALLAGTVLAGKSTGNVLALPQLKPPIAAPAAPPAAAPRRPQGAHDTSMLLRSAQLTLAVFEVDQKLDAVEATAVQLGGYLALRGDHQITVRVPRERFDEALKSVEKLGDVLHRSVSAEDVTDQFVDLELRLKNAHALRARLEKLLESASVRDAVEIQKELAKVTEEIERFEGKLNLLKNRVAFSTLTVTFERTEPQRVRSRALLPFPWMATMGLAPLLQVNR
jgi:hypothetical protein